MATERLLMRHIREILRLKWTLRRSHRETARSLGISAGAVASVVTRAKAIGADLGRGRRAQRRRLGAHAVWAEAGADGRPAGARSGLDAHRAAAAGRDAGAAASRVSGGASRRLPVFGVLRALPALAGAAADRRCARSTRPARKRLSTTPGSGRRWWTRRPARSCAVELFVAVLGASNYTYAEATADPTQRRFHPESHADRGVFWRRLRGGRAGSTADRRHRSVPV